MNTKMRRTKMLFANGYSLEAHIAFDVKTNELDMKVRIEPNHTVSFKKDAEGHNVCIIGEMYVPEAYEGSWENMPEFKKWIEGSTKGSVMMRVLYGFYRQHRTNLTDMEHDTIVALLKA